MFDIAIIGAGINGCFLARDLSRYELEIAVIEKDSDVANEATMANSAIVHSGHDPKEGTLKAKLNVKGNQMYEEICHSLGVSFERVSAFVVATSKEEEETLQQLYRQAVQRNIEAFYLSIEEARAKEPNLSDAVTKVMELPTTGIIYPWEVAIALMEEALLNNTKLYLKHEVLAIERKENEEAPYYQIKTNQGLIEAKCVINAAGVYADKVYRMVSKREAFSITARKGEYYVLDKQKIPFVSRVIYPVPSEKGKGVLAVPTTHGNTLLGPNSVFIDEKEGVDTTREGLAAVKKELSKTVKNIPMDKVIRTFSGLRPTGNTGDFVIEEAEDCKNFINVACIESPGLASAPAISEYVITNILKKGHTLLEKTTFQTRKPPIRLSQLSEEEKNQLVKERPAYGQMVCRCEQITEAEIIDAIKGPLGATTVKGVKKRVRPGMGRCQGGFCEPHVVEILARELGCSPLDIKLDGEDSKILLQETKGGTHEGI